MSRVLCEPGVYDGVPFEEYLAIDAISSSHLKDMDRSPAHCRYGIDSPRKSTDAKILGTALHTAILEPDRFRTEYVMAPEGIGDRKSKAFKEFADQQAPRLALLNKEFKNTIYMQGAVYRKRRAKMLLESSTISERTLLWNDTDTRELCKARLDRPSDPYGVILDLKTTKNASKQAFQRDAFNFGYHLQAAMYLRGCVLLAQPYRSFVTVAVENTPPFEVALFDWAKDVIEASTIKVLKLIAKYHERRKTKNWTGYPDEVQSLTIPAYGWSSLQ